MARNSGVAVAYRGLGEEWPVLYCIFNPGWKTSRLIHAESEEDARLFLQDGETLVGRVCIAVEAL